MYKVLQSPVFLAMCVVITLIFYISLSKTQQKTALTIAEIKKVETQNEKLAAENEILEEKLQNNNQEKIIRDEFLKQKPGEYVVKVPDMPEKETNNNSEVELSPWQKWKKILF